MESRAKILGHSAHQLLIVFPLGLLSTAVVFDVIHRLTESSVMALVSYWMLAAGIIGGLAAAPFGWIDWAAIPRGTRAKMIGLTHGLVNTVVLALFAGSWYLRRNAPETPDMLSGCLAYGGFALAFLGGWLGGELVGRMGVGVYPGAHLNSPNSLGSRPTTDSARPGELA